MRRFAIGSFALAVIVALALACPPKNNPPTPIPSPSDAAFHSPIQPLDRGVLSSIPSGHRDFRRDPPVADVVTTEAASGNDVRVQVKFAESGLPPVLSIQTEREPVSLRDDGKEGDSTAGDGIFTAITSLPPEFLKDRAEAAAGAARTQAGTPVFKDRQIVPVRNVIKEIGPRDILSPFLIPPASAASIDPARSLMITNPTVVNDPTRAGNPCVAGSNAMGPWSFGFLMNEMANASATGISGSQFAENWLDSWLVPQPINGPSVPARPNINNLVIQPWRTASGGGALDLSKAPLHLLAIVNRLDLGDNPGYGGGTANAGELRFVFGVMSNCNPTPFAVILEYGIPPKSCPQIRNLAQSWINLSTMIAGSPAYNAALQSITDPVVKHGAGGAKPNGSALNQLRTNEIALAAPWELREFRIDGAARLLRETTVKQTPIATLFGGSTVANYVNANAVAIKNHTNVVPLIFGGGPFLSGNAPMPPSWWNGPASPAIPDNDARNVFSLSTCNGCHDRETNTTFVHVNPSTPIGSPAALSGFLTGITVNDPAVPATLRQYHDLLDRRNKLAAKASSPCFIIAVFDIPPRMVH